MELSEFMEQNTPDFDEGFYAIPEGRRNSTMSHIAGCLIKRYGDTEEARIRFDRKAESCNPPLPDDELDSIWRSAQGFGHRVSEEDGYIPPEQYNSCLQFRPTDFSDTAQAVIFTSIYNDRLAFSHGTGYLVYDGIRWEESKSKTRDVYHEFTDLQLEEAEVEVAKAKKLMEMTGADTLLDTVSKKKAIASFNSRQAYAYAQHQDALEYRTFALQRRNSNYVGAALKEAEPMVEINPAVLDEDAFLLNTPESTIDLRDGISSAREHRASDLLTRCTLVSPGDEGKELWLDALDTFFGDDDDLKEYVQKIAGLSLIGNVFVEALIIAYGAGKNGKSTFWNSLLRVLGTYGGNISAEALTVGCRTNIKPELAEIRGKRLLIAAELEEGTRLSTSAVKKLCSTDEIMGEKKFLKPLSFRPSHNLVLYTNHLPKVGANDPGTWRRLIVVPFTQTIEGSSDIKNYAEYLVENAGPYILKWMIKGSQMVIAEDYHIEKPECVRKATENYRENSDWLEQFIAECCDTGDGFTAPSGEFYQEYRAYCSRTGDYIRSSADFYSAVEHAGFERKRTKKGRFILGVRLKTGFGSL